MLIHTSLLVHGGCRAAVCLHIHVSPVTRKWWEVGLFGGGGGSHRVDKLWGATPLPPLFLHLCCYQQLTLANSATVIVMQNYSKLLSVKKLLIALSPCFSYQYIKINVIVFIGCVRIVQFLFENIMMMIDDIIFGKCLSLVGIIFIQNTVKTRFDV